MKTNYVALFPSLALSAVLYNSFSISYLENVAFTFSLYAFLSLIYNTGRSFAFRELIGFIAVMQIVLAPTVELVQDAGALMVSSDEYLSYAIPSTLAFFIGIQLKLLHTLPDHELLDKAASYAKENQNISKILLTIGAIGLYAGYTASIELKAIARLVSICLFASVLYNYFGEGKYKLLSLAVAATILILSSVSEGMFGELLYWSTLWILIILVSSSWGKKVYIKLALTGFCLLFIVLVQSIKMEYRMNTWENSSMQGGDANLMASLVDNRLNDTDLLFGSAHLNATIHRLNQGYLVSHTMNYVPRYEPFSNGEIVFYFIYPLIPRLIWEAKPITGGMANITRYTPLQASTKSSSNISPIGEAYVNFGSVGGVIFIFILGIIINYVYSYILKMAENKPSLIFWLPCFFVGSLSMETDILSLWGSIVTMSIFLWVFWLAMKKLNINL